MNARGILPARWQVLAMLLCLMGMGVPHPVLVGGIPPTIQTWPGGTPHHPDLAGGAPGTPYHPDLTRGEYPGYPPHHQDLAGVPPRPGMGYSPCPDLGWGTPPVQTCDGVTPLRCGLTHKVKILPSPILRMRVVKIKVKPK